MDSSAGLLRRPRSRTQGNLERDHAAEAGAGGAAASWQLSSHRPVQATEARLQAVSGACAGSAGSTRALTSDQRSHSDNDLNSKSSSASTLVASTATYSLDDPNGITLHWEVGEETNANDWIGLYLYSETDASKWIDYKNKGVNGAKKGSIVWKFDYIVCHFLEPKTQVYFKYHSHTGHLRASTGAIIITKKILYSQDEHQIVQGAPENYVRFIVRDIDAIHLRKGLFFNPDPYIKMWLEPAAVASAANTQSGYGGGSGVGAAQPGLLLVHHRQQQRTTICEDTTAPTWPQQEFAFRALPSDVLYMKLMDKFVSSRPTLNRYLGHIILPVKTIQEKAKADTPLTLTVIGRSPVDRVSGTIRLYIDLMSADAAIDQQPPTRQRNGMLGDVAGEAALSSDDEEPGVSRLTLPALQKQGHYSSTTAGVLDHSAGGRENSVSVHVTASDDEYDEKEEGSTRARQVTGENSDEDSWSGSKKGPRRPQCLATTKLMPQGQEQEHMVQRLYQTLGRSPTFSGNQKAHHLKATSSTSHSAEQMPAGWSTAIDSCGRTYYVDRLNKTASWTLPEASVQLYTSWPISMGAIPADSVPTDANEGSVNYPHQHPVTTAEVEATGIKLVVDDVKEKKSGIFPTTAVAPAAASAATATDKEAAGEMVVEETDSKAGAMPEVHSASASAADHPALQFLTGNEFFAVVQEDSAAQMEYMGNAALRRTVQMIRSNPSAFTRYIHNADLVSFINKFALTKSNLPQGWEQKVDRNGKPIFLNALAKWTSYIDPRMPITQVKIEPPTVVPLPQGRYKVEQSSNGQQASSDYNSKVLAFLRYANGTDLLETRWPALKKNGLLKELIVDIIADGVTALHRYRNNVDLMMMLSLFNDDIAAYSPPPQPAPSDRQAQQPSQEEFDDTYLSTLAHLRRVEVPQHKQGFQDKHRAFRKKLEGKGYGAGPQKIKLRVRRDSLLQDAFNKVMSYSKKELQRGLLLVSFSGEEGLDYGGPAREFFFLLSRELFNPYYGLFEYSAYDTYTVQISPISQFIDNASEWFRFAGRILGLGIVHQYLMDCYFTRPFYKMLLGVPCSLSDLESLDAEFYQSLVWIRDNNISSFALDLTFSVDEEAFGQIVEHELKPGGKNIAVTEKNKKDYIERMVKWRITRGITEQKQSLLGGFREALDPKLIAMFDAKELELVIAGTAEIDVDEWKRNTEYRSGYHAEHPVIKRFWDCIESLSNDQRLRLLQFVTGTSSVPFEGFAALRGSHGPRKFAIERWGDPESLPRAHTCFNRLDLPPYASLAVLCEKLLVAIEETSTFGVE